MRKFKLIDGWISIVLIICFAVASITLTGSALIYGYIVVGCWQVISMLVHLFNKQYFPASDFRNVYNIITLFSLITMPVGSIFILLFIAPFMAIFYTWMCFRELHAMNQRPLAILK